MLRAACFLLAVALAPSLALAQTNPNEPRIIVVPVPGENVPDAGVIAPPPTPPPEPIIEAPPPAPPPAPVATPPPPAEPKETKLQANSPDAPQNPPPLEPTVPVDPNLDPASISTPPSAMLDGHPREGSFLSGPGSVTFLMHHTLMGSFGLLSTQMVPRIARNVQDKQGGNYTCQLTPCYDPTGPDARIAYLVGGLLGAGLGFTSAAFWQFYNWMSVNTATFGIVNSVIGAAFGIGLSNAITTDTTAISWTGFIAALAGAWLTAIVGGGDMAWNKGIFITSGGAWAAIYTALILGMVASTGGNVNLQGGFDALLIMPAIGAAALAIAGLKFHPSSEQILRADFFGAGVGLVVYLISSLLVPGGFIPSAQVPAFRSAVPYVLTAVGAAGAKVIVSLLWADTVNAPPPSTPGGNAFYRDPDLDKPYSRVWW